MVILLEGPDKCGKSTLAKNLSNLLDIPIRKHSETRSAQEALGSAVQVLNEYTGEDEIWDRFYYPSDLVYGELVGDYTIPVGLRSFYLSYVEQRLQFFETVVVYCYAPIETMIKRLEEEPDHYVNAKQLKAVRAAYKEIVYSDIDLPVISLNSDLLSEEEMVTEFYNQLLKLKGVLK